MEFSFLVIGGGVFWRVTTDVITVVLGLVGGGILYEIGGLVDFLVIGGWVFWRVTTDVITVVMGLVVVGGGVELILYEIGGFVLVDEVVVGEVV